MRTIDIMRSILADMDDSDLVLNRKLAACDVLAHIGQQAEAFLRKHGGDRFEVHSAGLNPAGINPLTVQVMNEVGIDMEGHRSKSASEYLGKLAANYVIFVCEHAEKSCPRVWPFALRSFCWPFPDPASCDDGEDEKLQRFQDVRDEIEHQIKEWLRSESVM